MSANQPSIWRTTIVSGLLTVGFSIWVAEAITKPSAAAWLADLRSTHHLNTDNIPPSIGWTLLAALAGLVSFLTFISELWELRVSARRGRAAQAAKLTAAREHDARKEADRLRIQRQANCSHPNTVRNEEDHLYNVGGGQMEEETWWVVTCTSCGKELQRRKASQYLRPMMDFERRLRGGG